jgi:hypothetical protein
MRFFAIIAVAVAAMPALSGAADAATRRHPIRYEQHQYAQSQNVVVRSASGTVIQPTRTIIHNSNGTTTVIVVPRRSYLDPGTEVSVGDTSYRDYMLPPGGDPGRANWFMGPDMRGAGSFPLPSAFSIPGYNPNTPY